VPKKISVEAVKINEVKTEAEPDQAIVISGNFESAIDIIKIVCRRNEISYTAICGASRDKRTVAARHAAAWVVRVLMGISTPAIGRRMGDRDHSTIINSLKRARELWGLPETDSRGSSAIAMHYLTTGEWDVSKRVASALSDCGP
jgi:chromosomal replication initiation ATPase DnaA